MRFRQFIYSSAFQVVQKVASFSINFVTIPIILSSLGKDDYGVYVAIIAIVNWFLVDNGIGEAVKFELLNKERKFDRISILSSGFFLLILIEVLFTLLVFISTFYFTPRTIFNTLAVPSSVWWVFYVAFLLIPLKLLREVLTADQKGYLFSLIQIVGIICWMAGVAYLALVKSENIVAFSMVYFVPTIISQVLVFIKLFHRKIRIQKVSVELLRLLGLKSFGLLLFGVSRGMVNLLPIFFINRIYGGSVSAEVSVMLKLALLVEVINSMILYPLWPSLRDAINSEDQVWVRRLRIILPALFVCLTFTLMLLVAFLSDLSGYITGIQDFITFDSVSFVFFFALVRLGLDYGTFFLRVSANISALGRYQFAEFAVYLFILLCWKSNLEVDILFYTLAIVSLVTRIPQVVLGSKWFYYRLK